MIDVALVILTTVSVAHLLMGLLVYLKNPHDHTNRSFFMFVLTIIGWLVANYASNLRSLDIVTLTSINKAVFVFPILMAYFAFTFSIGFTGLRQQVPQYAVFLARIASLLFAVLCATNLVITGIGHDQTVVNVKFGPLAAAYFIFLVASYGMSLLILIIALNKSASQIRARVRYIIAGIFVSFMIGIITNLILPLAAGNFDFINLAPISTIFLIGTISVAIVKHRLFDLRFVVARSVTFLLLLSTLGFAYSTVLIGVSSLIFKSRVNGLGESVIESVLALILAFTFQPLRRVFERMTDKIFYREKYDSQVVLNDFSKILVSELDLDRILKRSLEALTQSVHIQYAQLVVFNNDRVYRIDHVGPLPTRLMVAPELAKLNKPMIIADELEGGERKATLEQHGLRVSITLRTSEEFVGYLLLGDKLSGDIYSTQDIKLLEIIGKELAVAILNAKAYAEIQEFNLTLQARVDHATNRLRVANRHLKELDHAKDEFISMASHQLRTPLTTIKGYLSMLQEGDAGKLSAAQNDFVNYAFGASERMVNLISDLLNVSRLSAGRFLIQAKPTDMIQMVADEVRQLQSHAAAKNISLVFVKPEETFPMVELDDNKTRQVIMNFIDNAIYYTQEGEVRVVMEMVTPERVRLEVRDTGIGVPRVAQRKLFSKFFRAENAQIVRPDGTGLGLYLAKRVVEDQGGDIIFSSVEGKGSTFGFELPIKPQALVKTGKSHGHK